MATDAPIVPSQGKRWFKGTDVKLRWTMNPVPDGGIAGWTIKFGMACQKGGSIVLSKTCDIDDADNAVYSASMADADTDNVEAGSYLYETKRMDANNEAILSFGTVELIEPVGVA